MIAFPREAGEGYVGFAKATGADCIAIDNSVSAEWVAQNVQPTAVSKATSPLLTWSLAVMI